MYKPVTLLLFVLLINNIYAQSPEYFQLTTDANKLYDDKKYEQSWEYYSRAFKIDSTYSTDLYNGACSAALAGKTEQAEKILLKAVQNGYIDKVHMQIDPDLATLRNRPSWNQIINELETSRKQYRTDDSILKELKGYIERNQADSLRLISSDSFKIKISEPALKSRVNILFSLINQAAVKQFQTLGQNSNSSSNMQITNGHMKETREFTYKYIPPFYGDYTENLFLKNIGFSIDLEITKIKNNWFLNNLKVDSNYMSRDFDLNTGLSDVLNGSDTCYAQFRIISKGKSLVGNVVLGSNKQNFLQWFKNARFMKMDDFKKPDQEKFSLLSISFYRKFQDKTSLWGFQSFKTFELVFFDDASNQCLISNGEKYAFYKLANTSPIRNYIYQEIKNMK